MTTPKNDHGLNHRCTCPPKVEGPNTNIEVNRVAAIILSALTPLIEPTGILRASHERNRSFESLKHTLSSRSRRKPLHALPTKQAVEVIDLLEQGSREGSPLCAYDQKRFSIMLRKMCLEHKQLPTSYTITDELKRIGESPCGGGGSANVWRGDYRGSEVAIKILRVDSKGLAGLQKEFCREVVIWKQFKHPNLLQLVGAKVSPPSLMMVSEWMEHGTIMDFVTAFPGTNRPKLLADVGRGLKYLHDWPSVHADLKGSNVLIDSNGTARIADFGLASLLRHSSISISVTAPAWGGTHRWMAPELFDGKSRPSKESDIYALGMVIYEVLAHERPFSHVFQCVAVPAMVLAGERPSRPTNREILGLSENAWMLMERCWDQVPNTRPHAADILVFLETAARDWVSPSSKAIANLCLGRQARQYPPTTESVDTMSETVCGTIAGGGVCTQEVGQSPSTFSGEEGTAAARSAIAGNSFPVSVPPYLRFSRKLSPTFWLPRITPPNFYKSIRHLYNAWLVGRG